VVSVHNVRAFFRTTQRIDRAMQCAKAEPYVVAHSKGVQTSAHYALYMLTNDFVCLLCRTRRRMIARRKIQYGDHKVVAQVRNMHHTKKKDGKNSADLRYRSFTKDVFIPFPEEFCIIQVTSEENKQAIS
tara:strand:+ start:1609 stop:1998 length:390 start_codon:yes stop_codon:yes gene_type:complete